MPRNAESWLAHNRPDRKVVAATNMRNLFQMPARIPFWLPLSISRNKACEHPTVERKGLG
jgi:hypothetical protein